MKHSLVLTEGSFDDVLLSRNHHLGSVLISTTFTVLIIAAIFTIATITILSLLEDCIRELIQRQNDNYPQAARAFSHPMVERTQEVRPIGIPENKISGNERTLCLP